MSLSTTQPRMIGTPQPFQCVLCGKRFTRQENLRRHSAIHTQPTNRTGRLGIACGYCSVTFARSDLRRRHIKKQHPDASADLAFPSRARSLSNVTTDTSDHDASGTQTPRALPRAASPFGTQEQREQDALHILSSSLPEPIVRSPPYRIASPSSSLSARSASMASQHSSSSASSSHQLPWSDLAECWALSDDMSDEVFTPTQSQTLAGVEAFFTYVSPYLPFLHKPTFDVSTVPKPLMLSVLSLGFQHTEDPDEQFRAGTGERLSIRCFRQALDLVETVNPYELALRLQKLAHVQSCLLLEFCALMFLCGSYSAKGLELHSKITMLSRSGGLMQALPSNSTATSDLESLWREFVSCESHKRTLLALHQMDCMWYHFLSLPRSLSHLEIKHDVPCPDSWWQISSAAEWAHRTLTVGPAEKSMRYWELVRRLFSQNCVPTEGIPPNLEPYAAANIMLFLQSSVREASGWATMTGRLSMDRVEALKTALDDVRPLIKEPTHSSEMIQATCLEAAWQMAMLELQSWSPSHTGGVVEGSMDEALVTITSLATSRGFMFNPDTINLVKPHIDWFLQYLDTTLDASHEAPWVTLYAFEAFSVTWQMMHAEVTGVMDAVGVSKGDFRSAKEWALKVFARRTRCKLGRLIMASLATLGETSRDGGATSYSMSS